MSVDRVRAARWLPALVALALLATAADADAGTLGAKAARQIAALQQLKSSLSGPERKLDSRLAVALRRRRDPASTRRTPQLRTGIAVSGSGRTEVDVRATAVTRGLLERLRAAGAIVRHASAPLASVRAALPLSALTRVAGWKDVRRIDAAVGAITARETIVRPVTESKAATAARLDRQLRAALAAPQGAVVSQGDKTHAADVARARTRVNGVGVKVCALSDGVDSLAALQASGELPAVDVLPGAEGSGDEGTAMLEIVHDLAPKAELGFATAFTSDASFADNIRALRSDAGCDVILDDVLYFNEDPFQDGPIAQAVDAVTADGALYFSSAGNEGNTIDRTAGNYERTFTSSGRSAGKIQGVAHDFDPGPGIQTFDPLSDASGANVPVTLFWADPLGRARDDYDLYLFDADRNLVAFSQNVQNGDDDPSELLFTTPAPGLRLAIVRYAGAARYFQLSALRGRFADSVDGLRARVSPGMIRGHGATVDAFSTAAAPAADPLPFDLEPGDPANPGGPFPNPFTTAQRPERFTSDGPRRVFFAADGTPITPGNFTGTGGELRRKPDVTAADGVQVATPGFSPFFGTSAAVPHAAAIAALVRSGNPGAGLADVREAFDATALDVAPAGVDNRSGQGIVMAARVLAATGATPQPLVRTGTARVTATTDRDPYLEPGETGTLALQLRNVGDGAATGVSVRVSTDDPRATITPAAQSYGTMAADTPKTRSFALALTAGYPVGRPVALRVRVTFAGVLSPTSATLVVPTGRPASRATTFRYAGPPVPIPDASETGASVPIAVSAAFGYAAKLTFSIDGQRCTTGEGATTVGLDHTFIRDLVGTLTAPTGRSATLFQAAGGSGNNLCQVVFDDAAANPFAQVATADAPFTGTWRPAEPLSAFLADPVGGTWRFAVRDAAPADIGSIRAVSLHITGFAAG